MHTERDGRLLAELAERLREPYQAADDWVDGYRNGDMIMTSAAGHIAGVSDETIRRRAAEAEALGRPIGVQLATIWLISRARLLDWIEQHEGRPARLAAETKARGL